MKIGTRLYIGFGILLFLSIVTGSMALFEFNRLSSLTEEMYYHPLTVSNATRDIRSNIIAMHRSMKDVATSKTPEEFEDSARIISELEKETFKLFNTVSSQFLGNP